MLSIPSNVFLMSTKILQKALGQATNHLPQCADAFPCLKSYYQKLVTQIPSLVLRTGGEHF